MIVKICCEIYGHCVVSVKALNWAFLSVGWFKGQTFSCTAVHVVLY
jgi:hypothetical protein